MTEYSKPGAKFWAVGAFGLIWSVMGCYNYITQTNPEALAQFPESYQMVIKGRPGWVSLSFVIAVFGGALGSALMLMRRAVTRPVLLLSLLRVVVTFLQALWVIGSAPRAGSIVMGTGMSLVVAAYLVWFTHRKAGRDLLRLSAV